MVAFAAALLADPAAVAVVGPGLAPRSSSAARRVPVSGLGRYGYGQLEACGPVAEDERALRVGLPVDYSAYLPRAVAHVC